MVVENLQFFVYGCKIALKLTINANGKWLSV